MKFEPIKPAPPVTRILFSFRMLYYTIHFLPRINADERGFFELKVIYYSLYSNFFLSKIYQKANFMICRLYIIQALSHMGIRQFFYGF